MAKLIRRSISSHRGKTGLVVAAILFLIATGAFGGDINKKAGTTGFSFLKLGVGARAVALGGAYTSMVGDPSVIHYNPAGTVHLRGRRFLAGYHNYFLDIQSGFIAATKSLNESSTAGAFISYMNYGEFTRTDVMGVIDEADPTFSGGDFLLGLNYSRRLWPAFSAGMNLKFLVEYAAGYSAQVLAVDIGGLYTFADSLTRAGLAVYNLGAVLSGFSANSANPHGDKLPWGLRAGLSHSLRELPVIASLDAVIPNDNDFYLNAGLEMYKLRPLYLRLGYSTFGENYKTGSDNDALGGLACGFGLDWKAFQFSYAFVPYLDLGASHRVTVVGEF